MKRRNYLESLVAVATGTALAGCSGEEEPEQNGSSSVNETDTGSGNGAPGGDGGSPGQDNPSGDKSKEPDTTNKNYKHVGEEQTEPGGPHPKSTLEFGDATYILQGGLTENQKAQEDFKYSELGCEGPVALELTDGDETVEGLLNGDSDWEESLALGPVKMDIERVSCSEDPLEVVYQTNFYIEESAMPSESLDSQMDIGSQLEVGYADPDSIYKASL